MLCHRTERSPILRLDYVIVCGLGPRQQGPHLRHRPETQLRGGPLCNGPWYTQITQAQYHCDHHGVLNSFLLTAVQLYKTWPAFLVLQICGDAAGLRMLSLVFDAIVSRSKAIA